MIPLKNEFEEKNLGVKLSKNGLIEFIEKMFEYESSKNTKDPKNAKLWQEKLNSDIITMYLKSGGSPINPD